MIKAVQSTLVFFALTFCWKAYSHRQEWKVTILSSGHQSRVAEAAICECKFEQFNHPPYSPDLAPNDYCPFRNLTLHLLGARFCDDNELKAATDWLLTFAYGYRFSKKK